METEKNLIELRIPSKFGFEKIAADCVLSVAKEMGFSSSKINDLKTAVTEACLNAIEHGNRMDQNIDVIISINSDKKKIVIGIEDYGIDSFNGSSAQPDLAKKLNGDETSRGWGLFLIKNLTDKIEIKTNPERGKRLEMTLYVH